ncbi:MAG: DUF1403 family protein [Heliomarina sp.]|uniref:DUF1403 family protein n=1 Tax=Heliomarina sp. TaxID=2917556 RepID=UPI0040591DCE
MTFSQMTLTGGLENISRMPSWVTSTRVETLEDVAFLSGAALSHLHLVLSQNVVPQALLRDRLALGAATACVAFSGRQERERELRDALHLLRPGDLPGPAGEICFTWRRAVERPVKLNALDRILPKLTEGQIASWLAAARGAPASRVATVLETVLENVPNTETLALIMADAALAQAIGWDYVVPLLALGLKRADLRKRGEDLRLACHRAIITSASDVVPLAADLARRTIRLKAVAPKLRSKGAGGAVEIFLTRDAVMPSALPLPNRAARRLCDRLVQLGAVRELTGRDTFRLYGV